MENNADFHSPELVSPGGETRAAPAGGKFAPRTVRPVLGRLPTAGAHRLFWGKIAARYDGVMESVIGTQTRARILSRLAAGGPWGEALEIGCGTGYHTGTLAAGATRVMATDLAPAMVALARRRVSASNVDFRVADCRRLPFEARSFDTAFLGLVLHFADPETTLREVFRVVRPGGAIVIVNPGLLALGRLVRLGCRCRMIFLGLTRYRLKPPPDFSDFLQTGEALCGQLESNGWTDIRLERLPSSAGPFGLPLEYVQARRKPGLAGS